MSETQMTIFVCGACKAGDDGASRPGERLIEALSARGADIDANIAVRAVDCLAVCKRPATISFVAPGKWTYVIGDLDASTQIDDVIDMGLRYGESENGIVAWKDRPVCFRKGVVSRTPPLP